MAVDQRFFSDYSLFLYIKGVCKLKILKKLVPSANIGLGVFFLTRKPRFEYPGGVYHLIQRGNNREYIFREKEDKEFLLDLIREYRDIMDFDLYGYVIMGNHYHFVIKISEAPLKDIMHRINNKFSRYYNQKYKRSGHVFENRYKGILVIDDRYLLSLIRYVHQNPVDAKICNRVEDYIWSSDKDYRTNNQIGMVDIDFILNMLSENRSQAIRAYKEFMDENKKEDIEVFEQVDIIGRVNTIALDNYLKKEKESLDEILHRVTNDEKIFKEIKAGARKRYLSAYKKEFIEIALKENYRMKDIGASISISDAAVFKIYNKETGGI